MEKVTKIEKFEAMMPKVEGLTFADGTTAKDFLETLIAQTRTKNTKRSNKPSAHQLENADLGTTVMNALVAGTDYTVSDIQALVPELKELSNQRVTAVVRGLYSKGSLNRKVVKGKAVYTIA